MPTILLVDDNELLLQACALMLEMEGFHVVVASNGAEALVLVRSVRPAIVVTDLNMPVLDGEDLCRAIRADILITTTPVIVCTASAWLAPLGLCDGVLRKPVHRDMLLKMIESLLANS